MVEAGKFGFGAFIARQGQDSARRHVGISWLALLLASSALLTLPQAKTAQAAGCDGNGVVEAGKTVGTQSVPAGESCKVEQGATVSANGLGITGKENVRVNNAGTISTSGSRNHAIKTMNNATVENGAGGTITVSGDNAHGIDVGDGSIITNAGEITMTGQNASPSDNVDSVVGIYVNGAGTVTNKGRITATNKDGIGILMMGRGVIVNDGDIIISGGGGEGIIGKSQVPVVFSTVPASGGSGSSGGASSPGVKIINNGAITTSGNYGEGIIAGADATVINNGTIATTNVHATGIWAEGNARVTNSGTISTRDKDSHGIRARDNAVVANTGNINVGGLDANGVQVGQDSTITNSGAITVSGDHGKAISAGNNAVITNTGKLNVKAANPDGTDGANSAAGIYVDGDADITNAGDITATERDGIGMLITGKGKVVNTGKITIGGQYAEGIIIKGAGEVTNSGTITTAREHGEAILVQGDGARVTNTTSGTIITRGDDAEAIEVMNNAHVVNCGTIEVHGARADGILTGDNATVEVCGRIVASGEAGQGVSVGANSTVTHTGTIMTSGKGAHGIEFRGANGTVNNAGTIIASGPNSHPIRFVGKGNTLNLLPGSDIRGVVDVGDHTTVNFKTNQVLKVDDASRATFKADDDMMLVVDSANNRAGTIRKQELQRISRGGAAGGAASAGALAGGISSALLDILSGNGGVVVTGVSARGDRFTVLPTADLPPEAAGQGGGFMLFANSFAQWRRIPAKGTLTKSTGQAFGGLMGGAYRFADAFTLGIFGGAARTKVNGGRFTTAWFGGAFSRIELGNTHFTALIDAGRSGKRHAASDVPFIGGLAPNGDAAISGNGRFIAGELALGHDLRITPDTGLVPELRGRYMRVKGGTVRASELLSYSVGDTIYHEGRAQLALYHRYQNLRVALTSGVQATRIKVKAGHIDFLGTRIAGSGAKGTIVTGFFGGSLKAQLTQALSFNTSNEFHIGKGGLQEARINVGLQYRF